MTDEIQVYQQFSITSDDVIETALHSISEGSRPVYKGAILAYREWIAKNSYPTIYSGLMAYKKHLEEKGDKPVTINRKLSALRKFFETAVNMDILDEREYSKIKKVKNIQVKGQPYGRRLSHEEARRLLAAPDRGTAKGRRDYAILAVFLGCGLRRAEVASLRWDHLVEQEGTWLITDLIGKGGRVRTVPVPTWVKSALDACYLDHCTMEESVFALTPEDKEYGPIRLFTSIDRHGNWGDVLSPFGVWYIMVKYAKSAGFSDLKPHDLRRSFAYLARKNGAELDQLQLVLGHSNVATTQRYVNAALDYSAAAHFVQLGD